MSQDKAKNPKAKEKEEGAPAVVGQLTVSNDLLDFSELAKMCKNKECKIKVVLDEDSKDKKLTPRQRAILARKKNK